VAPTQLASVGFIERTGYGLSRCYHSLPLAVLYLAVFSIWPLTFVSDT